MSRTHILKGFSDVNAALWVCKYHPGLKLKDMVRAAIDNGYNIADLARFEAVQMLSEWGLIEKETKSLTSKGEAIHLIWETKRNTAIDILHGLQYSLWTKSNPEQNTASWAYKTICDYLWERQGLPESDQLVTYINDLRNRDENLVLSHFGNAFSSKSINDAYDWLLPLDPPVLHGVSIDGQVNSYKDAFFKRRQFCSTALFVMGLTYVLRESGINFGDLIELDNNRRREISTYCLIEETSFDFMLDDALRMMPYISIQKGWDVFVIMNREPELTDFLD